MRISRILGALGIAMLALTIAIPTQAHTTATKADTILDLIPSEAGLVVYFPNGPALDEFISSIARKLGEDPDDLPIKEMSEKFKGALDINKPMAIALFHTGQREPVFYGHPTDFNKLVEATGASAIGENLYQMKGFRDGLATQKGNAFIWAMDNELLSKATTLNTSVAATLGEARINKANDSTVSLHINIDPFRKQIDPGMAQAKAFAPMIAMGMAQQGGDPMTMSKFFTGLVGMVENFYKETQGVDVFFNLSPTKGVHATAIGNFKEGGISSYLAKAKGGKADVNSLPDVPYFMAFASEWGSSEGGFVDYAMKQIGIPEGEFLTNMKRYMELTSGANGIMNLGVENGKPKIFGAGSYTTSNTAEILNLTKYFMTNPGPFAKAMQQGISWVDKGTEKVGGVDAQMFQINFDEAPPHVQDQLEMMWGTDTKYALLEKAGQVHWLMGKTSEMNDYLGKVGSGGLGDKAGDTLAALPTDKNVVALINVAGLMSMMRNFAPPGAPIPNIPADTPPAGFSVSLTGQARVDINVPMGTLEPFFKMAAVDEGYVEDHAQPAMAESGQAAPDWTLKDAAGNAVSLKDLRGNVVVMDFWATWCKPCKKAMPHIQKIHEKYAGKPVKILGINVWEEDAAKATAFMKDNGYTYTSLLGGDEVAETYGVMGIPTFFVISPEGKIVHSQVGSGDEEKLIEIIDGALKKLN